MKKKCPRCNGTGDDFDYYGQLIDCDNCNGYGYLYIKTKVKDVIAMLQKYPKDRVVLATWEGILRDIDIYQTPDGTVLIDADDNHYKEGFISGKNKTKYIERE